MIFLDTGFLGALFSKRDANHKRVRDVIEAYQDRSLADLHHGFVVLPGPATP